MNKQKRPKSEAPAPRQAEGAEPPSSGEGEKPQAELEALRAQHEQTSRKLDEALRAYSGLLNEQRAARERTERERARVLENERARVSVQLMEVADELDRALAAAPEEGPLANGVRLIREGLQRRLQAMGVERMNLTGQLFDPNLAEAVDVQPVQDREADGRVVGEASVGYKLGERILRPARVRVARFVPNAQPPEAGDRPRVTEP